MTFVKKALSPDEYGEVLFQHDWMRGEPSDVVCELLAKSERLFFRQDDILFREGDKMQHCLLVETGKLQAFRHTYGGDEKIFGQFERGEFVAIAAVFMDHGRFPMNIRAQSDGHTLMIPRQDIHQFCLQRPELALRLLNYLGKKLYSTINQIDWLTSSSAPQRLADYLLRQHHIQQTQHLTLPVSRGQLATSLGMRSETLSRLMSDWKRQGHIIYRGHQVELCDLNYLKELAAEARRTF
ncbi:Crp/Fnr family transcriptional regulator [Pectobacterium carotovorum subsp. carotovorum]|uniref:Crp/Fnr family transcriptional regulator n=1 Tax=Pectobacterium carotovorum TaxID=554 RepID=UPI0015FF0899|nr:Crp/Fnr family transcriptional regulator [Pectobacterium carotovorum]MBB1525460.1 Crp/Fnr family transcriptional regulator [Pectobacterium carotovorum subsp. carotovorum]MCA6964580.1 Crp/Fnr family transcriptional regulator [Pectobacterium carotovorum]MCH4987013.1 Crp/Fnr family transcriptional regulator [Pectobacterium carotovorum]